MGPSGLPCRRPEEKYLLRCFATGRRIQFTLRGQPRLRTSTSTLRNLPPVHRLGRIATHPVFCWLASTVTVMGWQVPAFFELGMHSKGWHAIEHASFFAGGLPFWLPVIQPWPSLPRWPRWVVPVYLFLATLPCDALSAYLTFCGRVVYPNYLSVHRHFDMSALEDQESSAALIWIWVTFAYLVPAVTVTIRELSPQRHTFKVKVT